MPFTRGLMQQASSFHHFKNKIPPGIIKRFPESFGDFISTGDINNDYFSSTLDGDMVFKTFDNFTINEGHIVTTTNRCKGLCLYIKGNAVINGTLSMTARGCIAEGQNIVLDPIRRAVIFDVEDISSHQWTVPAIGAGPGTTGINGQCGGGGGSGQQLSSTDQIGLGSSGTSFSGGSGAGGCGRRSGGSVCGFGQNAAPNGGMGGKGGSCTSDIHSCGGGGGAGNPGGLGGTGSGSKNGTVGSSGTGGLLFLIVEGDLIIGDTGIIESNGSNGGDGYPWIHNVAAGSMWGCGSGGGSITILHRNGLYNDGIVSADGGIGGSGGVHYNGGAGSIRVEKY